MKPASFEYHRPGTVAEAVDLLAEHGHDAELMAGNQSLGIIMANRLATPEHVVDLGHVDGLDDIEVTDGAVRVGSMVRHRDLERSAELKEVLPMLPEAARQIAGPAVRNRGTMGGSVGEADPAGNYPAALVALDGTVDVAGPDGERSVPASDYFVGYMFTDLDDAEVITGVTVDRDPFPPDRTGMAFEELKRAAQTFPTVSAAASVRVDDPDADAPTVEDARVALANAADVPLWVPDAERALEGTSADEDALDAVRDAAHETADPTEEDEADREFKREVAGEYARRALRVAYERACGE